MKNLSRVSLLLTVCIALFACGTTKKVDRLDSNSTVDLSGDWNDVDSRLVAEGIVSDFLSKPWFAFYSNKINRQPSLVVGRIQNLSHEYINTNTFVNDIERSLINSGVIDFVASKSEREQIRAERRDQDEFASAATRKKHGQEIGADLLLEGSINTIYDVEGKQQVRFYQVDMSLFEIESGKKLWVGQKKIKKLVKKKSGLRF